MSVTAPRGMCVCNCLGGPVDVRSLPCVRVCACPCAFRLLCILYVHVSVSVEYVCVHDRVTLSCVSRQASGLRAKLNIPLTRGCRLQGPR